MIRVLLISVMLFSASKGLTADRDLSLNSNEQQEQAVKIIPKVTPPSLLFKKSERAKAYKSMNSVEAEEFFNDMTRMMQAPEAGLDSRFFNKQAANNDKTSLVYVSKKALGWGQIAYHHSANSNIFIQAPHRFHDSGTGVLLNQWWQSGEIGWSFMNNISRYHGRRNDLGSSDFSKVSPNPLSLVSKAYMDTFPNGLIFQIHGYKANKRKALSARRSDFILSHGDSDLQSPSKHSLELKACIEEGLNAVVLVFPHDTVELGATKSDSSKTLKSYYPRYLHIEISDSMRHKLLKNEAYSKALLACMLRLSNR